MRESIVGTGGLDPPPPLRNKKSIGSLSNTGQDPLKNHKATEPAFNVGPSSARQRKAIYDDGLPAFSAIFELPLPA